MLLVHGKSSCGGSWFQLDVLDLVLFEYFLGLHRVIRGALRRNSGQRNLFSADWLLGLLPLVEDLSDQILRCVRDLRNRLNTLFFIFNLFGFLLNVNRLVDTRNHFQTLVLFSALGRFGSENFGA